MSDPNVKIGLASRNRPDLPPATGSTALRAGPAMNKSRTRWHRSNPGRSPFRICSRDLTLAAGSRSSRREDDVEVDPRPGMVPGITAVGRGRASGLMLEVPHQEVPDAEHRVAGQQFVVAYEDVRHQGAL